MSCGWEGRSLEIFQAPVKGSWQDLSLSHLSPVVYTMDLTLNCSCSCLLFCNLLIIWLLSITNWINLSQYSLVSSKGCYSKGWSPWILPWPVKHFAAGSPRLFLLLWRIWTESDVLCRREIKRWIRYGAPFSRWILACCHGRHKGGRYANNAQQL